jgi:hypothetical protein
VGLASPSSQILVTQFTPRDVPFGDELQTLVYQALIH